MFHVNMWFWMIYQAICQLDLIFWHISSHSTCSHKHTGQDQFGFSTITPKHVIILNNTRERVIVLTNHHQINSCTKVNSGRKLGNVFTVHVKPASDVIWTRGRKKLDLKQRVKMALLDYGLILPGLNWCYIMPPLPACIQL